MSNNLHTQHLEETIAKLEAEAQALREQNTKFQHMLTDVVAKHFAENIKRSTAQKSMDVYLSEGIRLLEEEVADARRDAERHELRANQYSEELAALRARVVVIPEPLARGFFHPLPEEDDYEFHDEKFINGECDKCIKAAIVREDELTHLNGKSVSEGLLRRIIQHLEWNGTEDQDITVMDYIRRGDSMAEELRSLLGEGKGHE